MLLNISVYWHTTSAILLYYYFIINCSLQDDPIRLSSDRSERWNDRGGPQCQDRDAHLEARHQVSNDGTY